MQEQRLGAMTGKANRSKYNVNKTNVVVVSQEENKVNITMNNTIIRQSNKCTALKTSGQQ